MRQLLIATVILISGPANAMDYVKCEAMEKAFARRSAQLKNMDEAIRLQGIQWEGEQCKLTSTREPGWSQWKDCLRTAGVTWETVKKPSILLSQKESRDSLSKSIAKIKSDYDSQCY